MKNVLEKILAPIAKDYKNLSAKISEAFPTVYALAEASPLQISDAIGGDMQTSIYIRLVFALYSRRVTDSYKPGKKYSVQETENYLKALLLTAPAENLFLISYDAAGRFIAADSLGEGIVNTSALTPRRAIDIAVRRGAKEVIFAHNHPGGEATPSEHDLCSNAILKRAFCESSIKYLGHYIVATGECVAIESEE